jgi:hypothetical protein
MDAKLVVVRGKTSKNEIPLQLPTIIGRSREAGLCVGHPLVSRQHCRITEHEGALVVEDCGSLNGTLISGLKVQRAVLKPGEQLTVGPVTFVAVYEHAGDFPTIVDRKPGDPTVDLGPSPGDSTSQDAPVETVQASASSKGKARKLPVAAPLEEPPAHQTPIARVAPPAPPAHETPISPAAVDGPVDFGWISQEPQAPVASAPLADAPAVDSPEGASELKLPGISAPVPAQAASAASAIPTASALGLPPMAVAPEVAAPEIVAVAPTPAAQPVAAVPPAAAPSPAAAASAAPVAEEATLFWTPAEESPSPPAAGAPGAARPDEGAVPTADVPSIAAAAPEEPASAAKAEPPAKKSGGWFSRKKAKPAPAKDGAPAAAPAASAPAKAETPGPAAEANSSPESKPADQFVPDWIEQKPESPPVDDDDLQRFLQGMK